jgi:hypothetical protein
LAGFGEKAPGASLVTQLWHIFSQICTLICISVLSLESLVEFLGLGEALCNLLYLFFPAKSVELVRVLNEHTEPVVVYCSG